jgi:hypothetical protein
MDELIQGDAELAEIARMQMDGSRATNAPPASFLIEATLDEAKTTDKGKPVYVDVDIIEIRIGRDILRRPVTDADKRTYAAQYLAFKKSESQEAVEGFPLSQWAAIPGKALVKEFAHYGIRTVEQLAAMTDTTLHMVGPHMGLRQLARDWVADAKQQGPLIKLRGENDALRSRVEALERMVSRQTEEIERARQQGGALAPLPAPPVDDGRLARLEAALAALTGAQTPPVAVPAEVMAANGVKLNKDGTPRRKSGPKPRAQES